MERRNGRCRLSLVNGCPKDSKAKEKQKREAKEQSKEGHNT